ncbi:MAG TPA: hypothetical protein VIP11_19105 [Gemmatimonadaceae bacterium]
MPSPVREPQRAFVRMNGVALTQSASPANRIASARMRTRRDSEERGTAVSDAT